MFDGVFVAVGLRVREGIGWIWAAAVAPFVFAFRAGFSGGEGWGKALPSAVGEVGARSFFVSGAAGSEEKGLSPRTVLRVRATIVLRFRCAIAGSARAVVQQPHITKVLRGGEVHQGFASGIGGSKPHSLDSALAIGDA